LQSLRVLKMEQGPTSAAAPHPSLELCVKLPPLLRQCTSRRFGLRSFAIIVGGKHMWGPNGTGGLVSKIMKI